jgi:putative flippase GtrA
MQITRALPQFLRFGAVGVVGFCVDAAALYACVLVLHTDPYSGRVISYLIAATSTWALNRKFTFRDADRSAPHRQWAKFVAVNAIGGAVNYCVYAAIVTFAPPHSLVPLIGVAAGSLSGLLFNFLASRRLVFAKAG